MKDMHLPEHYHPPFLHHPMVLFMPQYAHSYVPIQYLSNIYPPMEGLERWTIFPELDMPYGMNPEYMVDE